MINADNIITCMTTRRQSVPEIKPQAVGFVIMTMSIQLHIYKYNVQQVSLQVLGLRVVAINSSALGVVSITGLILI